MYATEIYFYMNGTDLVLDNIYNHFNLPAYYLYIVMLFVAQFDHALQIFGGRRECLPPGLQLFRSSFDGRTRRMETSL